MIDPFTLSSIIISYAIHIGHIGYTIYQNVPSTNGKDTKKEIAKVEEKVIGDVKYSNHIVNNDIQNTVNNIKKFKLPHLEIDNNDDECTILTCKNVKIIS